ncbi:SMI1/KNR4 family protein [Micromonospora chokoriensis]
MALGDQLLELDGWLQRFAPASYASLRPSASPKVLREAAVAFGRPLHPALIELFDWHDGTSNMPAESFQLAPDFGFIGLSDALDEWTHWNAFFGDTITDSRIGPSSQSWFPIAVDWCGGLLVVDHDQPDGYGQVFSTDPEQGSRQDEGWKSLTSLVDDVLGSLNSRQSLRDYDPVVREGLLVWE